jgi:type I restriction enzyme S subunit
MTSEEEIPGHWEMRELGEVIEGMKNGGTPRRSTPEYWDGGDIPWLKISDLKNKYTSESEEKITKKGLEESSAKLFDPGTVLLTIYATVGRVSILEEEYSANQAITGLKTDESQITPDYLYYYLESIEDYFKSKGRGGAQDNINQTIIKEAPIPVPPLEEQEAIVEKLDEVFDSIEKIQEAQEQAEEIYQDLAFSFFTSRVKEAETETVDTGDLIEATQYGSSNATNSEGDGYPSLRMGNYNLRGEMDYSKIKYQELKDEEEFEKYKLNSGDVLFNRTNSSDLVGKMCIYDGGLEDAVFASYLIRVELDETKVLPEYFVTYMNSHLGEIERQGKLKQAVSQANINATELREMEMSIPSLEAQKEIVASLDYMRSKIDSIMSEVNQKGDLVDNLPKSILTEAFNGGLVDFNPDSASGSERQSDSSGSNVKKEGQQRLESFD